MKGTVYDSRDQRALSRVLPELIRSRELLLDLVSKDLRARYRYAMLGFLWAILEPLALTLILTFVFSFVMADKLSFTETGNGAAVPFPVSLLCGLVFWQFFATALNSATQSLVDDKNLVKKVYFPREVVPLAAVGYPLVNLAIGFILLLIIHLLFGGAIGIGILAFIPVFAIQFVLTVGLALLLSCGHVVYRDIGYMVSVATVFGFYASPVFYRLSFVTDADLPNWVVTLYRLNPMAELLAAYRQILFEGRWPDGDLLIWPSTLAVVFVALGLVVFRRRAASLSDYL